MVRRGLAADLETATEQIVAGRVLVSGAPAVTPRRLTDDGEPVVVVRGRQFVGRGGDKLCRAVDELARGDLGFDVDGQRALDVGASTGGFTDCLLQRGAVSVVAVDVGTHQLHERLRADPRVMVLEQTDIRSVDPVTVGAPFPVVTVDVSFISVATIMNSLAELTAIDGDLLVLVKPQFEVSHLDASRGRGVIRDPRLWSSALSTVAGAAEDRGMSVVGATVSSVKGAQGNTEFFLRLRHAATTASLAGGVSASDTKASGWIEQVLASAAPADSAGGHPDD